MKTPVSPRTVTGGSGVRTEERKTEEKREEEKEGDVVNIFSGIYAANINIQKKYTLQMLITVQGISSE